ncbi:hypothetical protein BCR36DRAFT_406382 [Piromyces finnis]|uniref:Uncharacterized protein n=1 Tax=Piromyces finnis TaxID=1754191 RepID=A0A1Y1V0C5_9FUNG|nr:hypothetical protein BCR36DRAFT_406382 [Piromyces finnis]|eukprot:ORX44541.1 hypothetical protein BCR36DRAFT_406382 [Piromyces finnis]
MQFSNNYVNELFNNKENEKNNDNILNVNPKVKYSNILKETISNNNYGKINFQNDNENLARKLRRDSSLNLKNPPEDKNACFRERRARSISFADVSQLSNSNSYYFENNEYNNSYNNLNTQNNHVSGKISHHRSHSSLNGATTLAKKRSFRKPKILLSSKEHIRRLKKMKSSSAISFKQNEEENKKIKRRYSIHSPTSRIYTFDDDFYSDKFDYSYSDLPPNTLYHELKQAREKELRETELEYKEQELEALDEETIYYDSDSTVRNDKIKSVKDKKDNDEGNNSLINLLLKYLEISINKEEYSPLNNTIKRGIQNNSIEGEIKEEIIQNSYISENSLYSDEESELHKQEELLESMFNDVIKNFYGYQSKFFTTIIKLISFLLYNGGKMELGKQILKYILKDKMGVNISSSDSYSSYSQDTNHFENEDIEYFTLNEIKEAKKHEKRRKDGYKLINKIWMIIHNVVIILLLLIFLSKEQPSNSIQAKSFSLNKNLVNNKSKVILKSSRNNNICENMIWVEITPVTWFSSKSDYQVLKRKQSYIDNFTGNIITNNCYQGYLKQPQNDTRIKTWKQKISPWSYLVILEFILIVAQLGFQYFIMDEIVPFFKPASYTSILFINQIINFLVQYKIIWRTLYNDLCLYVFILGIYAVCFS